MFAAIGFTEILTFAHDDIYSMVLTSIIVLDSLISKPGMESTSMNSKWLQDQSLDLLEMTYFNHELLVKVLPEVLASAIVISALSILTQNAAVVVYRVPTLRNCS